MYDTVFKYSIGICGGMLGLVSIVFICFICYRRPINLTEGNNSIVLRQGSAANLNQAKHVNDGMLVRQRTALNSVQAEHFAIGSIVRQGTF